MKTYSSAYVRAAGVRRRVNVDPEVPLIDEILAVGDVTFQQKCMEKFVQFAIRTARSFGRPTTPGSVRNFCDRAIWLDHGAVKAQGKPADVIDEYTETMLMRKPTMVQPAAAVGRSA